MPNKILISALVVTTTLPACAFITRGSYQDVTVKVFTESPTKPLPCNFSNDFGIWKTYSGVKTTVHRSFEPLEVTCYPYYSKIPSRLVYGFTVGNFFIDFNTFSGLIDHFTGASYSYPTEVTFP